MNEQSECRKNGECQIILQDLGIQLMAESLLSISPGSSPNINSSLFLPYWRSAFERKSMIRKQCGTNYFFFLNGKFKKTLSFRLKYIFNILTFPRNMTISDRINEDLNVRKNSVEYGNPWVWLGNSWGKLWQRVELWEKARREPGVKDMSVLCINSLKDAHG